MAGFHQRFAGGALHSSAGGVNVVCNEAVRHQIFVHISEFCEKIEKTLDFFPKHGTIDLALGEIEC